MNTESILGSTELAALLAVVPRCSHMLHFNMVSHISRVLACVIAH